MKLKFQLISQKMSSKWQGSGTAAKVRELYKKKKENWMLRN